MRYCSYNLLGGTMQKTAFIRRAIDGIAVLLVAAILIAILSDLLSSKQMKNCLQPQRYGNSQLIIDAGHGGEDGGAVSVTGTYESTLNLAVALKMRQLCGLFGIDAVLIREDDNSLKNKDAKSLAEMKRTDLKNRVKLINSAQNASLISIHQNFFSSSKDHGAQVFFAPTESSREWGIYCQHLLVQLIEPENHRQSKRISKDIYLMNHISCPAILVECGFLSNAAEAERLEQSGYQTQLALVILGSYMTYQDTNDGGEPD